jgi:hypothetical protein
MAPGEYGKHMGELKRGEQRWDVYPKGSPIPRSEPCAAASFCQRAASKTTGWIFLERQEKEIHERFEEFSP